MKMLKNMINCFVGLKMIADILKIKREINNGTFFNDCKKRRYGKGLGVL